ncbi:MAG: hypothetical protein AAGD34_01730 [Pseudomonadota bacterium]
MDATPQRPPPGGSPSRRGFATGYAPNSGDMMVYGGGVATLIGVLATVVNGDPVFLIISLAGSFASFFYWPTIDTKRPQLGASDEGIYVGGIGVVGWDGVEDWRIERHALRTMRLARLVITLNRPLQDALVQAEPFSLLRLLSTKNAKVRGGQTIRVDLHTLAMGADDIERRLASLSSQRPSARGSSAR